jgi:phosphoglycerate dehydrogenase-like enzyme
MEPIIVNTARGSLIDEDALYDEAKTGRIIACLDVTSPEPPAVNLRLRTLSNVIFTPHIAGAVANNMFRIGNLAVKEIENFFSGKKPFYPITKADLGRMA